MEIYFNANNEECVKVIFDNGNTWSGLKSAYDEMIAQNEAPAL